MSRVTVEVPSQFADLSTLEQESLIRAGMREAIQARVNELTRELREAETRVRHFEAKYGVPLTDFERDILPSLDDFEG
ncbi:MAG: hypothetical protein KDD83_13330, partial [Caldilineaceae bacterium]|nr:hypothetical protein [Caldilineaceae bacterium]